MGQRRRNAKYWHTATVLFREHPVFQRLGAEMALGPEMTTGAKMP
jgi:hypothetical protein